MSDKDYILSVVIPTKGRAEVLKKCVHQLLQQSLPAGSCEIIIVDDEFDERVEEMAKDISGQNSCAVHHLKGPGGGVGAARNLGALSAKADIVLIIGNDIIASPEFLAQHLKFHKHFPNDNCAVLGQTKLHPSTNDSFFMRTWGDLPYWEIEDKIEVPCWYFFTGNISFKKSFFVKHGLFDEDFQRIGFEDIEVGFRLHRQGLRIMYNKDALAYHHHPYTFEEACRQQINHGYNFGILIEKLKRLDCTEYLPVLGERYGIIGWHQTLKGLIKNIIKKYLLHKKSLMTILGRWLNSKKKHGRISAFMYPKVFNYFINQGLQLYKKEHNIP